MPTLRQAANRDMSGYKKVEKPAPVHPPSIPDPATSNRNPNMLASMPLMALTGDAFQRQFYGGTNVPSYRILPAKKGSGA